MEGGHTELLLSTRLEKYIHEVDTIINYTLLIQITEMGHGMLRNLKYVKLWHSSNNKAINRGTRFFLATGNDLFFSN